MKAVILAGGEGTRLRPLTSNTPKPMMPLANKPMMEHIVNLLSLHGFDEIVVTTFTAGPGTQTLPLWIFDNLFRPNQAPVVNVVAVVLVVISILPVWAAQRLGGEAAAESRL